MRRNAQLILGLGVSLLALALAFRGADLGVMVGALRKANYFVLAIGIAFYTVGLFFRALSWRVLLGKRVPYLRAFEALNEGYLLNNLLPFRLGEFGRAYLVSRRNNFPALEALSSIVVERVIDLLMVVILLVSFLPLVAGLNGTRGTLVSSIALGVIAIVVLIVVARNQETVAHLVGRVLRRVHVRWLDADVWEGRATSFLAGLSAVRDPARALQAALWSTTAWLAAALGAWFMLRALLPSATLTMAFVTLILTALGAAVPSAPSSAGVFEVVVVAALSIFAVDKSVALSFALTLHAINFLSAVVFGGWALSREGETLAHLASSAQALFTGGHAAKTAESAAPHSEVIAEPALLDGGHTAKSAEPAAREP